jgi:polysaccharide biosynthesis transport protein
MIGVQSARFRADAAIVTTRRGGPAGGPNGPRPPGITHHGANGASGSGSAGGGGSKSGRGGNGYADADRYAQDQANDPFESMARPRQRPQGSAADPVQVTMVQASPPRQQAAELRDYVSVIRRHKRSILVIVATFTLAGLAYSTTRPASYRSSARVLVLQAAGGTIGAVPGTSQGKPINLETEAEIVSSGAVAELARQSLHSPMSAQELAKHVDAGFTTDSQVLAIGFTADSPGRAQAGAQAFADGYLAFKTTQMNDAVAKMQSTLDDRLASLKQRLDDANDTIATAPATSAAARDARTEKDLLLQQIGEVQKNEAALQSFTVDPGQVIGPATLPAKPTGSHATYAVIGLLLGVVVGFGQAFFRDALDRRLTGIGDLEEVLGAPVMAVIPRRKEGSRRFFGGEGRDRSSLVFLEDPNGPVAEGYRTLRTGLMFALDGATGRAIMVTSATEGEGKSTTAANLAVAVAQSNIPVALVDADLRQPSDHLFFGASTSPGVIELLRESTDLYTSLQDVGIPRLRFIASGDVSSGTPELFSPRRLAEFIDELKGIGALVIVDTPPLIVSDPLALAPYMDGVLIVADSTSVTAEGISPLIERLTLVGGEVIGGVLNKYDPGRSRGYAAEYGYGSYGSGGYGQKKKGTSRPSMRTKPPRDARHGAPPRRLARSPSAKVPADPPPGFEPVRPRADHPA